MRIDEVTNQVTFKVAQPSNFSKEEISSIMELIQSESQVTPQGLLSRIKQAKLLAVAIDKGRIIAVSALKVPNQGYKDSVFDSAGVGHLAIQFPLEMGWKVVSPEYRGQNLGKTLSQKILAAVDINKVFATVRATNQAALRPIQQLGFKPLGEPYVGSSGNEIILLTARG